MSRVESLFPILRERAGKWPALLSGGEQQMLAVARALMSSPRYLLLDEPSLGLSPKAFGTIIEAVRRINARGHSGADRRAERPPYPAARRLRAMCWKPAASRLSGESPRN